MTNFVSSVDDALINTPFGAVTITAYDRRMSIELLPASGQVEKQSAHPLVKLICQQVIQYLRQPKTCFDLPLAQHGTVFQQRVWQAITQIPCGQTMTYSELARLLGSGPRAVANACGANQLPLLVPCHRVVAKNGIGGFMQGQAHGLQIKQWLLQHEGVKGFCCV
jgi:methylated-DNA-[protein]-cysteine S-methyltransferase